MKEAEGIFAKLWVVCLVALAVEFARVLLIQVQGNGVNVTILAGLFICFIVFTVVNIFLSYRNAEQ